MRPFPVDIIPAHVYLSEEDQKKLFGIGYPMTILAEHTQPGQLVYEETLILKAENDFELLIHVLGPNWQRSHVEVSNTEAVYLGCKINEVRKGDTENAVPCKLIGPEGEIDLPKGLIITKPHLTLNLEEAEKRGLRNGQSVDMEIQNKTGSIIEDVLVRVHPTFSNRLELHSDYARKLWIARQTYAKIV